MHARQVINTLGPFSTHQSTNTPSAGLWTKERKEKAVQQPSERDTVTGRSSNKMF